MEAFTAPQFKNYALLGRVFMSWHPDLAKEAMKPIQQKPRQTDLSLMPLYALRFEGDTDGMRLFICCMLHLYAPQVFQNIPIKKYGFVRSIANTLNKSGGYVSELIGEVITWYNKDYADFKEKVDKKLKEVEDE
ncbi:MAG: hypothetical protein V4615_05190 [Bacteroidota bacterium]